MTTTITLEITTDGTLWLHGEGENESERIGYVADGLTLHLNFTPIEALVKWTAEALALRMAREASGQVPSLDKEG